MSDTPSSPADLAGLEIDLTQSFVPAWAKETDATGRISRLAEKEERRGDRPDRFGARDGKRRDDRGPRSNRGPARDGQRGGGGKGGKRPDFHSRGRDDRHAGSNVRPEPVLAGWKLQFLPDLRGIEGVAKQIKAGGKTYPLFDLAWLILENPARYRVEFRRAEESSPALYQLKTDGSLWLSAGEAISHALEQHRDKFYRRERVAMEPPKGSYPFVAVCGMSGVLLGPPNYHDYQAKIRKLHAERFSHVPFETYKSRIRTERDEASVAKWKEEQSWKDEFFAVETPEGAEPVKVGSVTDLERHFRETHAAAQVVAIGEKMVVPGPAVTQASAPAVRQLVRRVFEELKRFPLPLAHVVARQLTSKGLHVFKAHKNLTYVSGARPRYLDRTITPVSDGVKSILDYVETSSHIARPDQWKAIVALYAGIPGTEAERETAAAADLSWLIREGHLIDYARRGLEAARKPKAPLEKKKEAKEPAVKPAAAPETVKIAEEPVSLTNSRNDGEAPQETKNPPAALD
jgi:hypothetical protein